MSSRAALAVQALLVLFITTFQLSVADSFLKRIDLEKVPEELKRELLAQIEVVLGSDHRNGTAQRVAPIEKLLKPVFDALPKNSKGRLEYGGVRYAIHRLFVQRHRWVIGGPETEENDASGEAPADIMQGRFAEVVHELFDKRTAVDGSSLHDVALLAATLEHLVKSEMVQKLEGVYETRQISRDAVVTLQQAEDLVDLYMMGFVRGLDIASLEVEQVEWLETNIDALYPPWQPAQTFLRGKMHAAFPNQVDFAFNDVSAVLTVIGDSFAEWQDLQCHIMKDSLLEMEDKGSGRVKLVNFYHAAIYEGKYQFTETINYLRQIGTLDESDPSTPRVIIPNYISGLSNCIARTKYYSVCCVDACESLFGEIERQLGKPDASAAEITAIVEVQRKKVLSASLHRRLDELAQHHNSRIPLHGRLFAQWMHLAYPTECSYPHMSGTMYTKTMEQWEMETGERSGSTLEEIVHWANHLQKSDNATSAADGTSDEEDEPHGMWTMEEELLVTSPARTSGKDNQLLEGHSQKSLLAGLLSCGVFVGGLAMAMLGLTDRSTALGAVSKKGIEKFV